MVDGPPGGLSVGERLEKLREYRARFQSGFRCGAMVSHRTRFQWEHRQVSMLTGSPCSYIVHKHSAATATVCSAPHLHGERRMREWTIPESCFADIDAEVMAIDVAQDLAVIYRILPGTS